MHVCARIPWNVKSRKAYGGTKEVSITRVSFEEPLDHVISQLAERKRERIDGKGVLRLFLSLLPTRLVVIDLFRPIPIGQAPSPLAETEEPRGGCVVCGVERDRHSRKEGGRGERRRRGEGRLWREGKKGGSRGQRKKCRGGESVEHRNSINVEMGDFATVFWVVQPGGKTRGSVGCWSITWHDGGIGTVSKRGGEGFIYAVDARAHWGCA